MATARPEVSIPHASLEGGWNVLEQTDGGRPAVAVREDERAGVAMVHPADEADAHDGVNQVAVLVNVPGEYLLLSGSFDSLEAVEWLLADRFVPIRSLPAEEYGRLPGSEVRKLLSGETLVLIGAGYEGPFPGALQLFKDVDRARGTWVDRFPRLENRFQAVGRLLAGVDLGDLARDIGARATGPPT